MYSEYPINEKIKLSEIGFFIIDKNKYGGIMGLDGKPDINSKAIFMTTEEELYSLYNFIKIIFDKENSENK